MAILLLVALLVLGIELAYHLHAQFIYGELNEVAGGASHAGGRRWSLGTRLWLLCAVGGLLWFVILKGQFSIPALTVAGILAILPVPIHVTLIHWLDRMEPEPPGLIIGAFLWGATIATVLSAISNDVGAMILGAFLGDAADAKVLVATRFGPVVEETAKGIALLVLFRIKRDEFDNIVDGIVYAAMVGLGFAMSENILYYSREFSSHGAVGLAVVFGMRGVISPYAHPLFTSMTGIGLGIAAQTRRGWLKWLAPLIGFCGAIFIHALWNSATTSGVLGFFAIYAFIMVPVFALVLVLLARSIRREAAILREQLAPDLRDSRLSRQEYEDVCAILRGLRSGWTRLQQNGWRDWLRHRRFQLAAKELAFHRYRTALRGQQSNPLAAAREATYLALLASLRDPPPLIPPVIKDYPSAPV